MTWMKLEGPAYWTLFVVAFLAVAIWESYLPKRALSSPAERRWSRHGLLLLVSAIAQAVVFRVSPVAVAVASEHNGFGLLNRSWIPFAIQCVLALLLIDLWHYITHRAFHSFSWLWRIHEVHHSDPDYDVSTAARFHPLEVVLTQGSNLAVVMLLAPPPVAVFVAGMLGATINIFVHANASLTPAVDRLLRNVFVTPNMHRIHHSIETVEQSTNLGQAFCWWDRLFGTYLNQAAAGEQGLKTGLKGVENDATLSMGHMLSAPFQKAKDNTEAVTGRI